MSISHWISLGSVREHLEELANLNLESFDLGFVRMRVAVIALDLSEICFSLGTLIRHRILSQWVVRDLSLYCLQEGSCCDPSSSLPLRHCASLHTKREGALLLHSIVLE